MDAIYSTIEGTKLGDIYVIANIIDTALDFIASYRDKQDKEILKAIKGLKNNQYVMIAWAAYHQQYRCGDYLRKAWYTNSTKRFY